MPEPYHGEGSVAVVTLQGFLGYSGQPIGTSLRVSVLGGASELGNFTVSFVGSRGGFDAAAATFPPVASPLGGTDAAKIHSAAIVGHPVNFLLRARDTDGVFFSRGDSLFAPDFYQNMGTEILEYGLQGTERTNYSVPKTF